MSINARVAALWVHHIRGQGYTDTPNNRKKIADLLEELAEEVDGKPRELARPPKGLYRMNYYTDGVGVINRIDGQKLSASDRSQLNELLNTEGMLWSTQRPSNGDFPIVYREQELLGENNELIGLDHDEEAAKVLKYANDYLLQIGRDLPPETAPVEGSPPWIVNELYLRVIRQARQIMSMGNIIASKTDPDPDGPVDWSGVSNSFKPDAHTKPRTDPKDFDNAGRHISDIEDDEVIDHFATKNARAGEGQLDDDLTEEDFAADNVPFPKPPKFFDLNSQPLGVDLTKDPDYIYNAFALGTKSVKIVIRRSDGNKMTKGNYTSLQQRFNLAIQ